MKTSEKIKNRLLSSDKPFLANDNISNVISSDELNELQKEIADNFQALLDSLIIDTKNDHNTQETAERVAKMYLQEVFKGRYQEMPKVTDFPNAKNLDEIYTLGPITVRSACSHHFVPIIGKLWIGIIPSEKVIGISKFARIADWIMSRPQIQEEAAVMLADTLEQLINPKGLAIMIDAQHMCMTWRGVKEHNISMTNSIMRGEFKENKSLRNEFIQMIKAQGFSNV